MIVILRKLWSTWSLFTCGS